MKPQRRSERCAIVNRTVSFNIEDPYQAALLERSKQFPNFSAAVKRWLAGEPASNPMPASATFGDLMNPQLLQPPAPVQTSDSPTDFDPLSALF
ncbi:MAG: hypothetical protein K6T83_09355 [Alicyclobacillus sp.]|nr:hypothetical protein [Alicyclobacillus sp.]